MISYQDRKAKQPLSKAEQPLSEAMARNPLVLLDQQLQSLTKEGRCPTKMKTAS